MVTKRTTRTPRTTSTEPEQPEVPQDVERARGKLGGGASKVRVWRIRGDGSESYCGETTTRNFGPEYVRAQWGPGDFLARYYDARDEEIDEAETFSIEPIARLTSPQERERNDDMPTWLPLLLRQMDRGGSSPVDPMKVATDIGGIAAQQMTGMFGVMEAMINRMKVPEASASSSLSAEKLLEIFLKGLEFGKENSGGGDDGYAGVIREVGKPLADLLGKLATNNPDGSASSQPTTTGPALPEGEQSMKAARTDTPFAGLAEYMPRLQQLARSGANVKLWAATILSQQPDAVDILANMASLAGIEETLEAFFQTFPDARTYDQWYRTLFGALLTEEGEEPTEPDE